MNQIPSASAQRGNNFDFLRIFAASLVFLSHHYAINGYPEPVFLGESLGFWGVYTFFSISGFLVSQSWRSDPHAGRFAAKRVLRIWPGLAVVTLISAFALGPIISTMPWQEYISHSKFVEFLSNLRMGIRYELPGVFEENAYPRAVNGSLWTIPYEVRCYIFLVLIGLTGLLRRAGLVLICTTLLAAYYFGLESGSTRYQYLFSLFFFSGVCLDLFRHKWEQQPHYLLGAASIAALTLYLAGMTHAALFVLLPSLAICLGTKSTPILKSAGKFGDISYGLYIYAFPVQQTVAWAFGRDFPFYQGMIIAGIFTVSLALLSWHLVERPALGLKRFLRRGRPPGRMSSAMPRTSL